MSNETFRFVRPVSQSKEADNGAAQATENMVGCVNDEVSSERCREHDGTLKHRIALLQGRKITKLKRAARLNQRKLS